MIFSCWLFLHPHHGSPLRRQARGELWNPKNLAVRQGTDVRHNPRDARVPILECGVPHHQPWLRHSRKPVPHPLPHRLYDARVVPTPNPGATPVIPSGTTGPEAASICYAHDTATLEFNTFNNIDRALCQKLLGAFEETFFQVKHKLHRGYSRSSKLDLLTHLYKTYTMISNADWIANNKLFREAYSPTNPIEVVWQQIDDAVEYADAGSTPYSSKKVVDNAY